ncbi:hypothetical protein H8356DRAFT_1684689 [Neocallimastix lanati (nom. inval.)]|jgi:hypothetical protein|nr:hypothetical protein H8356DRAFT_1684689 [Neocallimastix sp. JGI-2020a]
MDETIAEETAQELEAVEEKENTETKPEETTEVSEKPAEDVANKPTEEVTETKEGENKSEEPITEEAKPEEAEKKEEVVEKKEEEGEKKVEETEKKEEEKKEEKVDEVKEEKKEEQTEDKTKEVVEENKNSNTENKSAEETKESKSAKNSTTKLNEKESKSAKNSTTRLNEKDSKNGSASNLQRRRPSKEILNKYRSKSNLYGSISNLKGSKSSVYGSKNLHGSSMVLNHNRFHDQSQEPTDRITFENTYQLKPEKKFSSYEVKKMLDELLQKKFVTIHQEEDEDPETIYFQYETEKAQEMSKELANEILEEVKKFEYDRYKLVVDVTIGEYTGQGVRISSRAIWDTSTDSYASSTYRHGNVFVSAIVFGCYYE